MTLQKICGEVALQGRKAKAIVAITFQQKLYRAIAKTEDAVIKHYRIGLRFIHQAAYRFAKPHNRLEAALVRRKLMSGGQVRRLNGRVLR